MPQQILNNFWVVPVLPQQSSAAVGPDGRLTLKMDGGRAVDLDPHKHPHLDHGYAMTSHSSQGQTADRVLIHVDTELAAKELLNSRMALSPSRVDATLGDTAMPSKSDARSGRAAS